MSPLPIISTVLLALAGIQQNWKSLLLALVIPAACIAIVESATIGLVANGFIYALMAWALSAPFYALFAVVVHRTVILGSESLPNPIGMFWSARETRFIGWTIAMFLVTLVLGFIIGILVAAFVIALPSPPVAYVLITAVWLIVAYFYTRLSMIFPATAVDDETSFERAWDLTSGNGLRMMLVMLLAVGPFFALALAVIYLMPAGTVTTTVDILLGFVVMLVGVCTVSVTYRQLIRIEREQFGDSSDGPPDDSSNESPPEPPANPFSG